MSRGADRLASESTPFWLHAASVLSEGIVVREHTGRVVFKNEAADRILGPAADAILHGRAGAGNARFVSADGSEFSLDDLPWIQALRERRRVPGVVIGVQSDGGPSGCR